MKHTFGEQSDYKQIYMHPIYEYKLKNFEDQEAWYFLKEWEIKNDWLLRLYGAKEDLENHSLPEHFAKNYGNDRLRNHLLNLDKTKLRAF